jgi:hypothetical protein
VASSSALVVRNVGEDGDITLTGLVQSQKWPVGFGPSSELVVRDQGGDFWDGEDGDFPYPLRVFSPATPLDWALGCDKDVCPVVGVSCEGIEDKTMALLTAIEEDHPREVKGVCSKSRGRRELLNLECSINYDTSARPLGVGKARLTFCSVECFVWVSGQRAFGVLWVSGLSDCGVRGLFGFCGFFLLFCLSFCFARSSGYENKGYSFCGKGMMLHVNDGIEIIC